MKKGTKILIKKGCRIFSTHPRQPKFGAVAGRDYIITVRYTTQEGPNIQVHWSGSGNYWKWTRDTKNYEVLSDLELIARAAKGNQPKE